MRGWLERNAILHKLYGVNRDYGKDKKNAKTCFIQISGASESPPENDADYSKGAVPITNGELSKVK